ncbi:Regulatory protein AfsR [Mycobacteroides abscessus subsp. abscessus]|uniref:tetratricopeptide repeat protein n=1 Tax=Mycobacteroides abscessus TaxID=36809 RepID=UPI0009267213|nr:tetratricopeptide repeat protein [Mycobacteroides abscessus]SHT89673.1 Regulatory protein AfsR [Mycobacteroides abscessus subsp. abscessus]SLL32989.1 Regulatory protein AfsR [Mycobacteroides abscessus subsp. abscessus]
MSTGADSGTRSNPGAQIEIKADNNSTAIGRVGQLNIADASAVAIGGVGSLNVFLPHTPKATTSVLPIVALQSATATFVGRQEQLAALSGFLLDEPTLGGPSVAVVVGAPGVGKTALVRQVALSSIDQNPFHDALFADLHGYDDAAADHVQPAEMYGPLLQALGLSGQQIPESVTERAKLYHEVLDGRAAAGQAVLIWLDNVSDRSQIEGLIPTSPQHRTVVTTRDTFPHKRNRLSVELDVLPIRDAVDLLRQEIQIDGDTRVESDGEASERLAELCDRLPLALQIIASLIVDEPSRSIREFESELRAEEHRLDSLHYDDQLSVRAALALSYKRLPDNLQRLFRLLSQVPGGDVGVDAARWLVDEDVAAVRPQLMALVRSHLVQQHTANRWSMHDLVRIFASEMASLDLEDAGRALKNVVERYSVGIVLAFEWLTAVASETAHKVFKTPAHAAKWFEAERATAISIVKAIAERDGYRGLSLEFGVVLGDLLKGQDHWRDDFYIVAATTASVATRVEPQLIAASALSNFGTSLRMQGKYDECQKVLEEAVAMYESLGDLDRASGARSNIGNLLQELGQLNAAIAIYRRDLRQCPPETHPHSAAGTLTNLGAVLTKAGRPGEGVTELLKAVVLCRKIDDRSGLASALLNLGAAYIALSENSRDARHARNAVRALNEARKISHSLLDAKGRAHAANNLAVALCSLREFKQGIALFDEALEYFDQTGQVDQANRTRWHQSQARRAAGIH